MKDVIKVNFVNEVDVNIEANDSIYQELSDYFKFKIPNFEMIKRMMKNRGRYYNFDGNIRLFRKRGNFLPFGLTGRLVDFCKERGYKLELHEKILSKINDITRDELVLWIGKLNLKISPRDYQIDSLYKAIYSRKKVIVIPTSGGKSLCLAIYIKWIYEKEKGKILVIVPSKSLVLQ